MKGERMKDAEGFTIKCINTEWMIYDNRDNKDFMCLMYAGRKHCYGDDSCKYYKPVRREGVNDTDQ